MDISKVVADINASEGATEGRVFAYDCVRVPRKFNARSQATFRRYVYLFPLQKPASSDNAARFDVDCDFVNLALKK